MRRPLLILTVTIGLAGCGGRTIDGFTPGMPAACSPPVGPNAAVPAGTCSELPGLAVAALDAREPGHAAIVSEGMFTDGRLSGPSRITLYVFVFELADGSTKATGVAARTNHRRAPAWVPGRTSVRKTVIDLPPVEGAG